MSTPASFSVHFKYSSCLQVQSHRQLLYSPLRATGEGRGVVGGEAPRPGSCCLLEQFPGTVSLLINEVPFSVPMKKLSQRTQPTSPDPPSQASGRLVPGLVEGKGIRGWAPGAAGLHTGPACGAGTGTVLQSGSCLLCKQSTE